MTRYEKQLDIANHDDVTVFERYDMGSTRFKGLYCDGTVALSKDIQTEKERRCILAEELGHHYTTYGDILDQTKVSNRKQELRARLWAYDKLIGLSGILQGFKAGCRNRYELAKFLDVTEEFLQEALDCYREKYGEHTKVDGYTIMFEPSLAVIEKIGDDHH